MGFFTCKDQCKHLEGYEKGHRYFNVEGKYFCKTCNYKIKTESYRCPCCNSPYRTRRRKEYPHLREQQQLQQLQLLQIK